MLMNAKSEVSAALHSIATFLKFFAKEVRKSIGIMSLKSLKCRRSVFPSYRKHRYPVQINGLVSVWQDNSPEIVLCSSYKEIFYWMICVVAKAILHKFYLVHFWILWPISTFKSWSFFLCNQIIIIGYFRCFSLISVIA